MGFFHFSGLFDEITVNIHYLSLGVLGKFASHDDYIKYKIMEGSVCWLPTDDKDDEWFKDILHSLKISLEF